MAEVEALLAKYFPNEEAFKIVMQHGEDVKQLALQIVDSHPEFEADREFVAEAAMLHDIGICRVNSPRIGCHGFLPYISHGYLGREILEVEGWPRHALVCDRHIGVGLKKKDIVKRDLPIPLRSMKPKSIEEKIICFADLFYSKSRLGKKIDKATIRRKLSRHGEKKALKFDKWCAMFTIDSTDISKEIK